MAKGEPKAVAWVVVRDRARDILAGFWGIEMGRMDVFDMAIMKGQCPVGIKVI